MKLSGSSQTSHKKLTFERAKDSSVLSNFSCGITALDTFIHNELQDYLDMGSCNLFTVKDDDIIVAMFCLENSNLTLSDSAKENMREGRKPIPEGIPVSSDDFYCAFSDFHYLCKQKHSSFETEIEFMKILGNIIWLVFGGLGIAVEYFVSSLLLMITIIGIPFGIATMRLGILVLWPEYL